jgi:hypothetical protein
MNNYNISTIFLDNPYLKYRYVRARDCDLVRILRLVEDGGEHGGTSIACLFRIFEE